MPAELSGDLTRSPRIAASLLALGIDPSPGGFVIRAGEVEDDRRVTYRFEEVSACGQFATGHSVEILSRRADAPGHPAMALREFWEEWDLRRQETMYAARLDTPAGCLAIPHQDGAAAMIVLGHSMDSATPFYRRDSRVYWAFRDTQDARKDLALYRDLDEIGRDPEAIRSYLGAAAMTYRALVREIKTACPMLVVRNGARNIAISSDSSTRLQSQAAQILERGKIV
jgi:hypothetical protein